MINNDIISHIQAIELVTRRALQGTQMGHRQSKVRGYGFDFDQLRDYQYGDDVRAIDWKSYARTRNLLVRQCYEERNRTLLIAVDRSASTRFGRDTSLWHTMVQCAAALSFVGYYNKDMVGLIMFDQEITMIRPGSGYAHTLHIVQQLFMHQPSEHAADIGSLFTHIASLKKDNIVLFLLTDALDDYQPFQVYLKRYETIVIRCLDALLRHLSVSCVLPMQDMERQEQTIVNTQQGFFNEWLQERYDLQRQYFTSLGIDCLDISDPAKMVKQLVMFLQKRMIEQ